MGRSSPFAALFALAAVAVSQSTPAPAPLPAAARRLAAAPRPEIVVARGLAAPAFPDLGLGDGGVAASAGRTHFTDDDDVVTPGGVRVVCRTAGVKLLFPSGRELLVAPDGFLHLRSGESGGPFRGGVELWLADGTTVRVTLAQSSQIRLREVTVGDAARRLQPWRRGEPCVSAAGASGWAGPRACCAGDGGDVYRAIALGPLLVLDRALVAADRVDATPRERLAVLVEPLAESLRTMQRQHREPDAAVRGAMKSIAELATHAEAILPAGAALSRVERDRLRWQLAAGFELEYAADGPLAPLLQLYAPGAPLPMVEWTLHADGAAFLANPREDRMDKRWHGNGTRLPATAAGLQARDELHERALATAVIGRLRR
jgi:hypothetical protein